MFPLKDVEHVDRVACWVRPPRKYGSGDEPWVSTQPSCRTFGDLLLVDPRRVGLPPTHCRRAVEHRRRSRTWRTFFFFVQYNIPNSSSLHTCILSSQARFFNTLFCSIQEYIYITYKITVLNLTIHPKAVCKPLQQLYVVYFPLWRF